MPERDNADAAAREAERPSQIPPSGWFAVLKRVQAEVHEDNVSLQGLGKVPECLVQGLVMPRSGRTRVVSRALRRRAAAMLRSPR